MASIMDDQDCDGSGHDEGPGSPQGLSASSAMRRACDACRARKIRCDRNSPCSQCLHIKIECTYVVARPKEKRSRILLTTQYERKIDLIDQRLQGVTQMLEDLRMSIAPSNNHNTTNSSPNIPAKPCASGIATPGVRTVRSDSDSPLVEGDSSLTAHSVFANEFLQNAVRTGSLQDNSLEMRETLDSLHHIVNNLRQQTAGSEMSYPHARPIQRQAIPGSELPPIQTAVSLIKNPSVHFLEAATWLYEYIPEHRFPELCLSVYFSDNYSEAEFIIVNAGLHYLMLDHATRIEEDHDQYMKWAEMCQENLETALSNLPLHLPANSEMIVALIFGVFHSIELSKPSLSWTLNSKASELCQTLGYHRISPIKNEKKADLEHRMLLFWSVYYIDKSLSLRLGRASTIPDWDVTVPEPMYNFSKTRPIAHFFYLWVRTARCQGKIYEQLYSPDAIAQPDQVRLLRVQELEKMMKEITAEAEETNAKWIKIAPDKAGNEMLLFFEVSDRVLRFSLLTLIYRASPVPAGSSTFTRDCVDTARAALQEHQECIKTIDKLHSIYFPSYVHWTVLFAPFIPFIVLFCHVIETRDQNDLARLHAFVTSMQTAPNFSDAAAKLFRLFQVLYSVALRYVELQAAAHPAERGPASIELENYLAQLGFPAAMPDAQQQQQQQPAPSFQLGGLMDGTSPMMWMGNTAQLDEWFNSNQQMMGLMQEPSFNFPPDQQ